VKVKKRRRSDEEKKGFYGGGKYDTRFQYPQRSKLLRRGLKGGRSRQSRGKRKEEGTRQEPVKDARSSLSKEPMRKK